MKKNCYKCFNKDGTFKRLNFFYETFINPSYLTNISIMLTIIFCLCKNYFLIQSIMPLLITNGITIIVQYITNNINDNNFEYKKRNIKYICNYDDDDQKHILNSFNKSKNFLFTIFYSSIIHFWLPILIIGYGRSKKYGNPKFIDKSQSNFLSSLFICLSIVLLYGVFCNKDQYIVVDIDENNMLPFIFKVYLPILVLSTYFYFYF